MRFHKAVRPCPRFIVLVPIERFCQRQTLGRLHTQSMDIVGKHKQSSQLLTGLRDAEFRCLLDGVHGIAAGVCQTDHISATALCLQQERREILVRERHIDLAHDLATVGLNNRRGVFFEGVTEGVVCGHEEPLFTARVCQRRAGAIGKGRCVICPVHGRRAALFAGQRR